MKAKTFDVKKQFEDIKKAATDAIKSIFPVRGKKRTLLLENVWVEDNRGMTDFKDQANTKRRGGTWGVPVYASFKLIMNADNKTIDQNKKIRLFLLPKPTGSRFSYIVNGSEYQVSNQLRLKPGVYTVRRDAGDLKTQVNLAKGKNFDLIFDEASGVFKIHNVAGSSAYIPLYPILAHLGVSHDLIARYWGARIADANRNTEQKHILKAKSVFGVKPTEDIKDVFKRTVISPDTTKTVLGEAFSSVDGKMLLAAAKNLLDVHTGRKEEMDRDSLEFKDVWGIDDHIKERIEKNKKTLLYKVERSLDNLNKGRITSIINPEPFNKVVETFFTMDDKSSTPEQTNPINMLSEAWKATITGSGGINSEHGLVDSMRELHSTHYGFLDPVHTPEGGKIGANYNIALGAVKDGKDLKTHVFDRKGVQHLKKPADLFDAYVAFPDPKNLPMDKIRKGAKTLPMVKVKALYKGKIVEIPANKVDFFSPRPQALFSWSANLVPFMDSNQGTRLMMASKHIEQAISLKHREPAKVQASFGASKEHSFDDYIGKGINPTSPVKGVVDKVTKDAITIRKGRERHKVDLYNNFSLNRETYLNNEPLVKPGDQVEEGQVLADNNYTKGGTLALGTNLKAAYIPYKGYNFEDGIVITDTAAEKLTSLHIRKKSLFVDENIEMRLRAFNAHYPSAISLENRKKLDDRGVIKIGSTVESGDVLIAALRKKSAVNKSVSILSKQLSQRPSDASVRWTLEDGGVVTDVVENGKTITVYIKTEEKAKIGDKLSGRMGNKGIITKIIPDEEAPKTKDGEPVQIMLNPAGVIGRININQIYDSALGKVSNKIGQRILIENFSDEDNLKRTMDIVKKTKTPDKEELFDGETGKSLGQVHVGMPHILKLYKQSTTNFSVRQGGPGAPYDMNLQPQKAGGYESSKALDILDFYSMLSHGAKHNLREMATIKADKNDEFWKALKSGQILPPPKQSFIYDKFINYLKASGIDTKKEGSKIALAPLTDKQVLSMSKGPVKDVKFYRGKDMSPVKGGFFDPIGTGGFNGGHWTHLELKEPVVNPVFETAVNKILDLGGNYNKLVSGELWVSDKGEFNTQGEGLTGGRAIEKLLKGVDIDREISSLLAQAKVAKATDLDKINKKLRYLNNLKKYDLKPHEAYMRKVVPVIPPKFRPIYGMPNGSVATSDVNYLYQRAGLINEMMKKEVMELLPESEKKEIRKDLHSSVKALAGLEQTNIMGKERDGFIAEIAGVKKGSPKEGMFIRKMLSRKQDFTGRGTIIPEPSLSPDEVALPEDMAWKLFEPFVIRELGRFGKTPLTAMDEIKKRSQLASKALEMVMNEKKVLLNRDPSLHKFSIMAFKPKITSGKAIKIPPLVVKGFNADFDGDTMVVHVPIGSEANKEAEKLLPSNNLFRPGFGHLMLTPQHEAQLGLFYLSRTSEGLKKINNILGPKYAVKGVMDKSTTQKVLQEMGKTMSQSDFTKKVFDLKELGDKHSYEMGTTLGLDDIADLGPSLKRSIGIIEGSSKKAKTSKQIENINTISTKAIDRMIERRLANKNNALFDMVQSGARGDKGQLRQILASPLFVEDQKQRIIPYPIKRSYAEGLTPAEYWSTLYGSRKTMIDKSVQTQLPGAASKEILATTIDNIISKDDCGTHTGVFMDIKSSDVIGRFLAKRTGMFSRNSLMDSDSVNKLIKSGIRQVEVRTPLKCLVPKGTCAKCYGIDEFGKEPEVGSNVGVKAGQTISEPLTQAILRTFHGGGIAGSAPELGGYKRIEQLLEIPKIVPGAAPLAEESGEVTKITKGLAGGFDVFIGKLKYHVPQGRELKVKVGKVVSKGDPLSTGSIEPQNLVKYKGMGAAQQYLVDELQKAYASGGDKIEKKVFETIVRSLGNTTRILNNPKDAGFVPGDVAPYTVVNHYNNNLNTVVPIDKAIGMPTTKAYPTIPKGKVLDEKDLLMLEARGIDEIEVKREPIKHAPFLKGVKSIPLLRQDWMAALGFQKLKEAITTGASEGWSTDVAAYHPIPAFAYGVTFGKDQRGKY